MEAKCNKEHLLNFIKDYFYAFNAMDGDAYLKLWKEDGRLINVGNSGKFLYRSPEDFAKALAKWKDMEVDFTCQMQEEPHSRIVDGLVASIEVRYNMIMPESIGEHTSFFHLICDEGQWKITSLMDRGFEKMNEAEAQSEMEAVSN